MGIMITIFYKLLKANLQIYNQLKRIFFFGRLVKNFANFEKFEMKY